MSAALVLFLLRSICDQNSQLRQNITEIRSAYAFNDDTAIFSTQHYIETNCSTNWLYEEFATVNPTTLWSLDSEIHIDDFYPTKKPLLTIIHTEDANQINNTIKKLKNNPLWNAYGKTLVLVHKQEDVEPWIKTLWLSTMASHIVILEMSSTQYYTWYPYGSKDCNRVNTIRKTSLKRLFQYKLGTNHYGCSIRVACTEIFPFVVKGEGGLLTNGVESTLMRTILDKFKFRLEFVELREFFWFLFHADGSIGGGLKDVYENYADVAYSGVQRRAEYAKYAEMLNSHTEDSLAWFVPTPKYIASIDKIRLSLKPLAWTYIASAYVLVTIALIIITLATQSGNFFVSHCILDSILNAMKAYISTAISNPKHHILKFLYFVLYIYSIHVTTIFQSALIYMLSNKITEVPVQTIEEALDRNMEFHFYEIHRNLINDSDSWLWRNITEKGLFFIHSPVPPYEEFLGRGVFIGPRAPQLLYLRLGGMVDDDGREHFFPLKESFMSVPTLFIMTPGHPLAPLFDDTILHLLEGGFCQWWFKNLKGPTVDLNKRENKPLTIESLSGAFLLFAAVSGIASIVFLLEMIIPLLDRGRRLWRRTKKKANRKF